MIADLKPYPEYKDSGLPWLGKVPAIGKSAIGRRCSGEGMDGRQTWSASDLRLLSAAREHRVSSTRTLTKR